MLAVRINHLQLAGADSNRSKDLRKIKGYYYKVGRPKSEESDNLRFGLIN
jgi:hypothetical protein